MYTNQRSRKLNEWKQTKMYWFTDVYFRNENVNITHDIRN